MSDHAYNPRLRDVVALVILLSREVDILGLAILILENIHRAVLLHSAARELIWVLFYGVGQQFN